MELLVFGMMTVAQLVKIFSVFILPFYDRVNKSKQLLLVCDK
jgi:hypothetical protein